MGGSGSRADGEVRRSRFRGGRRFSSGRTAGLAVVVFAVGALAPLQGLAAQPAAASERPSQADPVACPPGATCGTITVPLDRDDPAAGTTEVAYALVHRANRDRPAAGTIAMNPGGPGGAAIPQAEQFAGWLGDLMDDHDLLLMDPRGTGGSAYVGCEVRPDVLTLRRPERVQEMGRCGESIAERSGFYTSAAAADDLDAIRARLDVPELKLYGISYGTNLMTTYAQRHPERVDSMVLSGAVPLDRDPFKRSSARATRDALRLVCERSEGICDPDRTVADFGRLARRLRRQPIRYPITVDGERRTAIMDEAALVTTIYGATGDVTRWGQLPAMVRDALAGDHDALVAAARDDLQRVADLSAAGTAYSLGMALSVMCNDWPTVFDKTAPVDERIRQYDARRATVPAALYRPFSPTGFIDGADESDWCLYWPDRTDRTQTPTRPDTDAPVLVFSGDLDVNTPPEDGRRTAAQFREATHLEVPNAGHVPTMEPTGCTTDLTEQFFRTHHTGDTTCLTRIPPVPVTPPASS